VTARERYDLLVDVIADAKRTVTAAVGVVALLLAQGALSGRVQEIAQFVVAVGTVLGVYRVTDGRKPKPCAATTDEAAAGDV